VLHKPTQSVIHQPRCTTVTRARNAPRGDFSIAFCGLEQPGIGREGGRGGGIPLYDEPKTLIFDDEPAAIGNKSEEGVSS